MREAHTVKWRRHRVVRIVALGSARTLASTRKHPKARTEVGGTRDALALRMPTQTRYALIIGGASLVAAACTLDDANHGHGANTAPSTPKPPGVPLVALFDDGVLYGVAADGRVFSGDDLSAPQPALTGARSIAGYSSGWVILGSAPDGYACAAMPSGEVLCKGSNENGALDPIAASTCDNPNNACPPSEAYCFRLFGPETYPCVTSWTPVPGVHDVVQVHATCGLTSSGQLVCWGKSHATSPAPRPIKKLVGDLAILDDGSLFDGTVVVAGIANVVDAANDSGTNCAVEADGSLWCWGNNSFGLVGDGTTTNRVAPVKVGEGFASVRIAGLGMACGVMHDGGLSCWGVSGVGADAGTPGIACGTETCVVTPTRVAGIVDVVQVVPLLVGETFVLTRDGRVVRLSSVYTVPTQTVVHSIGP